MSITEISHTAPESVPTLAERVAAIAANLPTAITQTLEAFAAHIRSGGQVEGLTEEDVRPERFPRDDRAWESWTVRTGSFCELDARIVRFSANDRGPGTQKTFSLAWEDLFAAHERSSLTSLACTCCGVKDIRPGDLYCRHCGHQVPVQAGRGGDR